MGKALDGTELGRGITQRRNGSYYGRVMVNGSQQEFDDTDLNRLRTKLTRAKDNGQRYKFRSELTVAEWFDKWFDIYKAPLVKESSIAPMKNRVKNTILPFIGKKKLSKLTNFDYQIAISELITENRIARGSIREASSRLEECFAAAVNNGFMASNPAYGAVIPGEEKEVEERRFLSPEEIKLFLETAEGNWWYEMLYTMIHTGMRIGEISGLCWEDIDWKNKSIKVRKNLTTWYENGQKHEKLSTPKTVNSYRKIPFMGDLENVLLAQKEKVDRLKKELGPRYRGKGELADLVFVTTMGSPCTRYNAEKAINKTVKAINDHEAVDAKMEGREPVIFERCYPHALRHTFASICFKAGMNPKVVQSLMGHANYSTTINIYTHIMGITFDEDVDKFNALAEGFNTQNLPG